MATLKVTTPTTFWELYFYAEDSSSVFIPENFFVTHSIHMIWLDNMIPKIHPEAFGSSRDVMYLVAISNCNLIELSFSFLTGIKFFMTFYIYDSYISELRDFPTFLPKLTIFHIEYCKGLNEWTEFPTLKNGISIKLNNNGLNNEAANRIIKWIKRGLSSAILIRTDIINPHCPKT